MQDFWLVMGTLAADQRLHDAIIAAGPDFRRLGLTYQWPDEEKQKVFQEAGEFQEVPTERMRDALNDFFHANYPDFDIPVSLYCAGKLCQLIAAAPAEGISGSQKSFLDVMADLRNQFKAITGTAPLRTSKGFLSLMGLSLVDRSVRARLINNNLDRLPNDLHFSPNGSQLNALQEMVRPMGFATANPANDPLNNPTWNPACRESFFFYAGFKRPVA